MHLFFFNSYFIVPNICILILFDEKYAIINEKNENEKYKNRAKPF